MKILDFPELVQTYDYDCGAKALQAVLAYYGIEKHEDILMIAAKTNKEHGTATIDIEKVLRSYDLKFDSKSMSPKDLRQYVEKKIPVFVLLQAWNDQTSAYTDDTNDGHWVVVIGYDNKKLYFEDPYTFVRTFLADDELILRWHAEENGLHLVGHGIAVYGKEPSFNSKKVVHMD